MLQLTDLGHLAYKQLDFAAEIAHASNVTFAGKLVWPKQGLTLPKVPTKKRTPVLPSNLCSQHRNKTDVL